MTRRAFVLVLMAVLGLGVTTLARADERDELKARFKERFATLVALKRDGKVGETFKGLGEVVKKSYAEDRVEGPDGATTVGDFLNEENRDRKRLYQLLAEETGATPEAVARRDAERRFKAAKPDEFLQPRPNEWVKKRDL